MVDQPEFPVATATRAERRQVPELLAGQPTAPCIMSCGTLRLDLHPNECPMSESRNG